MEINCKEFKRSLKLSLDMDEMKFKMTNEKVSMTPISFLKQPMRVTLSLPHPLTQGIYSNISIFKDSRYLIKEYEYHKKTTLYKNKSWMRRSDGLFMKLPSKEQLCVCQRTSA